MNEQAMARKTLFDALDAAGSVLKKRFGKVALKYKGRANIVTQADLESQEAILKLVKSRLPSHDYRAEEAAVKDTGADCVWVVDPLDGTTNFAHGYPASCVSIGVVRAGKPWLAGVYDPFRDEAFTAEAGKGAKLNGKPMKVSKPKKLSEALLITGFPYDRSERSNFYIEFYRDFMTRCHDVRRSGSAALDIAWIAAGRAEGFWEFGLSPWDVAAGRLLVTEAGGKVTDFYGQQWGSDVKKWGRQTLATNGLVHAEMLKIIRSHPETTNA
jgi:myo-inositol-1(or 4)-monophosphatase